MPNRLETITANVDKLMRDMGREPAEKAPEHADRIIEGLRRGVIYFYGEQAVEVGLKDIDWSGRHVQHQEWPAQLNRFQWLATTAAVYRQTKDESLAALVRGYIEDWIDQHTYNADTAPTMRDNTLNISIRLGQSTARGWWANVGSFLGSKAFDDAFIEKMHTSSAGQLDCLRARIAGESNWRISHLDTLFFCGQVVPGLDKHHAWAIRNLNETFLRQIHEDGSHEEHNPNSYHGWMTRVFTAYWRLSLAQPQLGFKIDSRKVTRMWDYLVHATAPDGGSGGLHDGPRWSRGPGQIEALDTREQVLRDAGLADDAGCRIDAQPARYFASAGQLFVRDQWRDKDAAWLCFDATRWGGGHCHLSRNAISFYAGGRMLLCDPGIFSYEASDPFSGYGKSTPAHSTVNFDGLNQCEANPDVTHVALFDDISVINSVYEGGHYPGEFNWSFYEGHRPGVYGQHARTLLWLAGRGAMVFDTMMVDREGQHVAAHWQLQAGEHGEDLAAGRAWTQSGETNLLVQAMGGVDPVTTRVYKGQHRPIRGWLPVNMHGERESAAQVAFEIAPKQRWTHLETLLMPFRGAQPPTLSIEAFTCDRGRARGYRIDWGDGEQTLVAAAPNLRYQVGETAHLSTDAALAVVSLKQGRPARATIVEGSYLEVDGGMLLDEPTPGNHRWQG